MTSPHGHGVIVISGKSSMYELQFNLNAKTLSQALKTMKWVELEQTCNLKKECNNIEAIIPIPFKFNTNLLTTTPIGDDAPVQGKCIGHPREVLQSDSD